MLQQCYEMAKKGIWKTTSQAWEKTWFVWCNREGLARRRERRLRDCIKSVIYTKGQELTVAPEWFFALYENVTMSPAAAVIFDGS
jgi:hypothetical protein